MMSIAMPIAAAAVGGLFGALAAPRIATRVLARKRRRLVEWWDSNVEAFSAYQAKHGKGPDAREKGADGAVGIWLDDARRQFLNGKLTAEQARDLQACGALTKRAVEEYLESPRRTEAEDDARYASAPSSSESALCAACCAAGFLAAWAGAAL